MIMPSIRTVIADDEHLARKKLRLLLGSEPGVQVVAECEDGQQTVGAVQDHRPDLLLIDIRMPDLDGFQVLRNKCRLWFLRLPTINLRFEPSKRPPWIIC